MNVAKEIDNFFPGIFQYYNVREDDVEEANMMKYWHETSRFLSQVSFSQMSEWMNKLMNEWMNKQLHNEYIYITGKEKANQLANVKCQAYGSVLRWVLASL